MLLAASVVVISVALSVHALSAQPAGLKRTILQKRDVSAPGREVVQALVEIPAGARAIGSRDRTLRSIPTLTKHPPPARLAQLRGGEVATDVADVVHLRVRGRERDPRLEDEQNTRAEQQSNTNGPEE